MGVQRSKPNCTKSTKQHVYTPNQLRSIGKQYKNGSKPGILPFGAIRQIRDLNQARKNTRNTYTGIHLSKLELTTKTEQKSTIMTGTGVTPLNILELEQ